HAEEQGREQERQRQRSLDGVPERQDTGDDVEQTGERKQQRAGPLVRPERADQTDDAARQQDTGQEQHRRERHRDRRCSCNEPKHDEGNTCTGEQNAMLPNVFEALALLLRIEGKRIEAKDVHVFAPSSYRRALPSRALTVAEMRSNADMWVGGFPSKRSS